MDIKDFALHYNLSAEQQNFILKYGYDEVACRLTDIPDSLSEAAIRAAAAKLRKPVDIAPLLAAAEEIKSDPYTLAFYNYLCYYWWERKESMLYGNKLPKFEQRPVNKEHSGTYNFLAALAGFQAVEKSYEALGLPPEIASDTLQYLNGALAEYASGHNGQCGVAPNKLQWMRFYVDGKLFRIGRFEYMIQDPYPYLPAAYRHNTSGKVIALCRNGWKLTADGRMPFADDPASVVHTVAALQQQDNFISGIPVNPAGFAELDKTVTLDLKEYTPLWNNWDLVPGIHIPGGGGMTPELCIDSLRRAREFFARYFHREVAAFSCFSWIFNTQFEEELPESNLAKFMQQVYLVPYTSMGVEGLAFVFGRFDYENRKDFPRDNSLRKAFHRICDSGRRLRAGAMFIEARGIEKFGQMIYRKEFAEF